MTSDQELLAIAQPVLERWIDAIRHPLDEARLLAAVTANIQLDRHEPGSRELPGQVAATLVDAVTVGAWLRLAPEGGVFDLVGSPVVWREDRVRIEYAYRLENFANGGIWIAKIIGERIAHLSHRPFALENQVPRTAREPTMLGGSNEGRSTAIRALKARARELFDALDDDVVMVSELRCTEAGCPPVETVIALLREATPPRQVKVHKAAADVTDQDLRSAITGEERTRDSDHQHSRASADRSTKTD